MAMYRLIPVLLLVSLIDTSIGYRCQMSNKIYATLQESVCLVCSIPFNTNIEWLFTNYLMPNLTIDDVKYTIGTYNTKHQTLVITNFTDADVGAYQCVSTHYYMPISVIKMTVHEYRRRIPQNLTCLASLNGSPLINSVTWSKARYKSLSFHKYETIAQANYYDNIPSHPSAADLVLDISGVTRSTSYMCELELAAPNDMYAEYVYEVHVYDILIRTRRTTTSPSTTISTLSPTSR